MSLGQSRPCTGSLWRGLPLTPASPRERGAIEYYLCHRRPIRATPCLAGIGILFARSWLMRNVADRSSHHARQGRAGGHFAHHAGLRLGFSPGGLR
jgi:hypothetical protein